MILDAMRIARRAMDAFFNGVLSWQDAMSLVSQAQILVYN